jgi:hypothetical protein
VGAKDAPEEHRIEQAGGYEGLDRDGVIQSHPPHHSCRQRSDDDRELQTPDGGQTQGMREKQD